MHDEQAPAPPPSDAPGPADAPPRPSIADGRERKLDPRSIRVDQIAGAIFAACVSAASLVGVLVALLVGEFDLLGGLLLLGAWVVFCALFTGAFLAWPRLSWRHTAYEVSEQGLRIRRGVVWRTLTSVPRSRVQHTDVAQGPIERMYDLATLVLFTAGTQNSSISLRGLEHGTALLIRDHLVAGADDDAV
jgi:membrane protein YdbS with pleckstrin-like domain